MIRIVIILSIILSISKISLSQCGFVTMYDSSSEYFSQLAYVEEATWGFTTYMRKIYSFSDLDDYRNAIYFQKRDECMTLMEESPFLRLVDIPNRVIRPQDYTLLFPANLKNNFWVTTGSLCLYYDFESKSISIQRYPSPYDLGSFNFGELDVENFMISSGGGILSILDSQFQVKEKYRSTVSPTRSLDSNRLFFGFLPFTLPLFSNDTFLHLMDIEGDVKWKFRFGNTIPYLHDWDYSQTNYFLIGSEDLNGNNVAFDPVIYKFDKQGHLLAKKFIGTNSFKAAIGTRCLFADEYLFVAGWQTVSRRPKELKQTFIAKLDLDLNVILPNIRTTC